MAASWRWGVWCAWVLAAVSSPAWAQSTEGSFAALSPEAAMVVRGGRLLRADHGAWRELPVAGALPRDVTAARGALWVLAEGTGTQSGVALVLRVGAAGDLALAGTVNLPAGYTPRSLAVARDNDWLIAGTGPLLRVRNGVVAAAEIPGPAVASVRWMPDEIVAVRHVDGSFTTWRWGESHNVARSHVAALIPGVHGTLVLREDGAVEQGTPWVPLPPGSRPWLPPSGITPVDAVVLRDQRVVEVSADGHGVIWNDGGWQPLDPAPTGAMELALTPQGPLLALRDGRLCALAGTRWDVRVTAIPGTAPP